MSEDLKAPVPPRPPLGALYPEPHAAMTAFLQLATLPEASAATSVAIDEVWRQVARYKTDRPPIAAWIPLYGSALAVAEKIVADADREAERLRLLLPGVEETTRIQATLVTQPQAEANQLKTRLVADVRLARQQWDRRLETQSGEQILPHCLKNGRELLAPVREEVPGGFALVLAADALDSLRAGYVAVLDHWTGDVTPNVRGAFEAAVVPASRGLRLGRGQAARPPLPADPAKTRVAFREEDAPRVEVDMPGWLVRVLKSMRSVYMSVAFIGSILAVGLGAGTWALSAGDGQASSSSAAKLVVAALGIPFAIAIGFIGANDEKRLIERRTAAAFRTKADVWLKSTTHDVVEKHKERLERWIEGTERDWSDAVGAWWEESVVPGLGEAQELATRRVAEVKARGDAVSRDIATQQRLRDAAARSVQALRFQHRSLSMGEG